ncbi:MAG: single-stranded-DNA-specific exonuclease RecJ [Ruminococcus sp.]|nr:single-stranded-DNA-specific exonuclease RecJ [Ruminococcus sp.]
MKLWTVAPLNKQEANEIQSKYDLPSIIAMLLSIRGINTREAIENFLGDDSQLASPFEIKDMDKAVNRIRRAIEECEPICVYGDYDADGVTATTLMYSYLETVGANAMYYIPSREDEGYGMNNKAVDFLNEKGIKLIVTVDNGIAAINEIAYAKSLGIDTVVTDHHMPLSELPNACAVVDLHRSDCNSKFKHLSGVGVAFKVIMAIEGEYCDTNSLLDNYADLLAIGTIGDIVELTGENRVFVKRGLESIINSDRIGINALIENSGLAGKNISASNVSFTLVPRINAVGRLGLSHKCVSLFMTEDFEEANEIASELCSDNTDRQNIEKEILKEIDNKIKENPSLVLDRIIVIDGEDWRQGVVGIVASRVKEIYGKPTIIISRIGDVAKASGRSVEGFPLCDAVFACADLLTHYGGHPMAVGLALESKKIELFRKRINEYACSFGKMPYDSIKIDCKLNPAYISTDIVSDMSYLQPFGAGNPTPLIGLYNMTLKNIIPLSNNKHLKLVFTRNGTVINAMKFSTSCEEFPYTVGDVLDLAVTLSINEYNGNQSVSVIIKEIKASDDDNMRQLESLRLYEDFCLGNSLSREQAISILPTRDDFAILYRFLRQNGGYNFQIETLMHRLSNKLDYGKIKVIIEAMNELHLIEIIEGMNSCKINLLNVENKVDIGSARIIKALLEVAR